MTRLVGLFGTLFDLLLVVLGFSLIIFVHELGHFVAARWAGIRVLAFAIGFGPALVSYRRGFGWRRGSSEPEYDRMAREGYDLEGVSPTEYRVNAIAVFGGYVKMLGQDDLDPTAVSEAPDSYQNCPPWKRMIVISAGVVMNVVAAAVLFVAVFMLGLETEPPKIGGVSGPAERAVAVNGEALGVDAPGLEPGDVVLRVNGRAPNSFNDVYLASAMARRGHAVDLLVRREGVAEPLRFEVMPEKSPLTGLLSIGVEPARSATLYGDADAASAAAFEEEMARLGVPGVKPGMTLVRVGEDTSITGAHDLSVALASSGGAPVEVEFEGPTGEPAVGEVRPVAELMQGQVLIGDRRATIDHLLGLTPVMTVGSAPAGSRGYELGLREGDVFVRLGAREFPSIVDGIREIRAHAGRDVPAVVDRGGTRVELSLPVRRKDGTVGFGVGDTARDSTLLALPPARIAPMREGAPAVRPAAASIVTLPGMRVVTVEGRPVSDFGQLRAALLEATTVAKGLQQASIPVTLGLELPMAPVDGDRVVRVSWSLSRADVEALHALGWRSPISTAIFAPEEFELRAEGPLDAVAMGVSETNRVMLTTYATFERLFSGTVKVEHLKGPVGIAHIGTRIADRGIIWLMFFMALISVNLAVINFLPLPIVDGGQFVLLVIEQVQGRPVPVAVQNAISMAGLVLIGAVFLLVTFNDIKAIFGV